MPSCQVFFRLFHRLKAVAIVGRREEQQANPSKSLSTKQPVRILGRSTGAGERRSIELGGGSVCA